jgi:opacity protein-like surface antigen
MTTSRTVVLLASLLLASVARAAPAPAPAPPPPPAYAPAPAPAPAASLDQGWTGQYAMLFNVQSVVSLSGYGGGVGFQYTLSPESALRLGGNFTHTSDPAFEISNTSGGVTTKELSTATGSACETLNKGCGVFSTTLNLNATFVKRLSLATWSPYVGAGAGFTFRNDTENWEDKVTVAGATDKYDSSNKTITLNVGAVAGMEWRVHKQLALYAEYGFGVRALAYESLSAQEDLSSGSSTATRKQEASRMTFLDFGAGLTQGGAIGVVAFW